MKKNRICALILAACLLALPGCSGKEEIPPPTGQVVRQDQNFGVSELEEDADGQASHAQLSKEPGDEVFEIREKMFVAQSNDIYLNAPDYLGRTIKYEGIFKTLYVEEEDMTVYYVIRYGPGCCGYDSECGFEIDWGEEYPQEDDWVEVVGVLGEYEYNGNPYLKLDVSSLNVKAERGAEYVMQ